MLYGQYLIAFEAEVDHLIHTGYHKVTGYQEHAGTNRCTLAIGQLRLDCE